MGLPPFVVNRLLVPFWHVFHALKAYKGIAEFGPILPEFRGLGGVFGGDPLVHLPSKNALEALSIISKGAFYPV